MYIYIYINFVFFAYYNIVSTHTHAGLTGFTFTWSFVPGFSWLLSLVETVYEHDPSYQERSQRNLAKAFFVIHGEVLAVSNIALKSTNRRSSIKKSCSYKFSNINRKTLVLESLFNKFAGLQAGNFITKRFQHRCFPVNIVKFLKTSILKDICERLLLNFLIQNGRNNRKNRDLFRDDNRRRVQNSVKHVSWNLLQK